MERIKLRSALGRLRSDPAVTNYGSAVQSVSRSPRNGFRSGYLTIQEPSNPPRAYRQYNGLFMFTAGAGGQRAGGTGAKHDLEP